MNEVASATDSLVFYQRWLEARDGSDWSSSPTLRLIREYNRDDCESTWTLACWLRNIQKAAGIVYVPKALAPESDNLKQVTEQAKYAEGNACGNSSRPQRGSRAMAVHELLSWFLEFHRPRKQPVWWARYERHAMTEQELIDDPECLGGLVRTSRPSEKIKRSYGYQYRFNAETGNKASAGKQMHLCPRPNAQDNYRGC